MQNSRDKQLLEKVDILEKGEFEKLPEPFLSQYNNRLCIFEKDYRVRRLSNFGLGSGLICTIQLKRIKKIKVPDIMNSTIEIKHGLRLAWNKAWLDTLNKNETC